MRYLSTLSALALTTLISCHEKPQTVEQKCEENIRYGLSGVLGNKIVGGAHAPADRTCEDSTDKAQCEKLMKIAHDNALEACKLMPWKNLEK